MTTRSEKPKQDHSFSAFAIGVSIGAVAALIFGTEEGRKIAKKAWDTIPEKYKNFPTSNCETAPEKITPMPPQEETPHHAFAPMHHEAPPPPPPMVHPMRPEPYYPPQK